jgi:hypothetical protein
MKIKPIKAVVAVYGGAVLIGLVLDITGIVLKDHTLQRTGLIFLLSGFVVGSVPLVATSCYLLWKKMHPTRSSTRSSPSDK